MVTRLYTKSDSEVINSWCKLRNINDLQEDQISTYGVIVQKEETPLAAIWIYPVSNCKVCHVDNLIIDPTLSSEIRDEALNVLFSTVHLIAKDMGIKYIKIITNVEKFKTRLVRYGYSQDLNSYSQFTGVL